MSHLRNLKAANLDTDSLVTIGVFDGVHLGHQQLIQRLVDSARVSGRKAVVLTFYPHPDKVLETVKTRYYLMTPEKRAEQLLKLGVDLVVTHPFDNETRHLPAASFIDLLIERLRIKELWVGADFALGFQRKGDVRYLRAQGEIRGFKVTAVELISAQSSDEYIRSSVIRDHVQNGNMRAASAMLGRAYTMEGPVVAGERRGRSIGAPTANLSVWSEQIIPANGVYATWARIGGESFPAATNVGLRPTFAGDAVTIEAHLLDFDRDIYGESMELAFERRLRPEQKFSSLDDLVAQIQTDIAETRRSLQRDQSV
ncbi:MAG: bifunctional riboflavin kinase/FAD synthetase [Chloroflexota bacterium]|nr:bifunctional riboflavin kinase/FAD synthetase [Chloroflexota bacterium]MDE2909150.1 bifunctional riboflavin kinase/FAD synthetase [Chloroflexota bacterium]